MADTPKTPQQSKKPVSAGNPNAPRRTAARKLREEEQQRLVLIVTAAAIGLALIVVLGGVLYDQLWVPSRPVARVGSTELSRRSYWDERRGSLARQVVQNFQLLALFGGNAQFAQQFQGQSPVINQQVAGIRTAEVDTTVVGEWESREVKTQGAAGMGLSASDDEVKQALAKDLGVIFIPPPTETLTPTVEVTPTLDPAAAITPAASPTAGGPTATPAATVTPAPTETPQPTPDAAEAATQVDQIIDEIYRRFEIELAATGEEPRLTKDDFRAALNEQYREQVLTEKVQAELVKTDGFTFTSEPNRVGARQILVAVTPPAGATQEQIDAAFAEARPTAEKLVADLRGGADFAEVAATASEDPGSKEQGGDLGTFDRDGAAENGATYPPELVAQAFTLAQGTVSDPIRTQFGWHIIEVTSRDVPTEEQQLREARTKAFDTWVEEQRTQLTVARFPEPTPTAPVAPTEPAPTAVPTFLPGPPTAAPTETPVPTGTAAPAATPGAATPTATRTP